MNMGQNTDYVLVHNLSFHLTKCCKVIDTWNKLSLHKDVYVYFIATLPRVILRISPISLDVHIIQETGNFLAVILTVIRLKQSFSHSGEVLLPVTNHFSKSRDI